MIKFFYWFIIIIEEMIYAELYKRDIRKKEKEDAVK